jgi:hypothetical protein
MPLAMEPFEERKIERTIHAALGEYQFKGGSVEGVEPETAGSFLKVFLDAAYKELRTPPGDLEPAQLEEILLHWMPRRISAKRRGSELAVDVIEDYFKQQAGDKQIDKKIAQVFEGARGRFAELLQGEAADDFQHVVEALSSDETKVGRNDPCPCGSGKKHKKCCMNA